MPCQYVHMSEWMCVCMSVRVPNVMYCNVMLCYGMYICTHVRKNGCTYVCMSVWLCVYVCTYVYICVHMCTYVYNCVHIICVHIICVHMCMDCTWLMIRIENNMYVHMDGMYSTNISGLYGKYVKYAYHTPQITKIAIYQRIGYRTMRRVGTQLTTHLFGLQQHTVCVLLCLIVGQIVTV